jgi:hypothetical protein
MTSTCQRGFLLSLATACAVTMGCAHWQHAQCGGLVEELATAMGDGPPAASTTVERDRPSRVEVAEFTESGAHPAASEMVDDGDVRLASAEMPVGCGTCCDAGTAGCETCCCCPLLDGCCLCSACKVGHRRLFTRPEPGPPPVRFRPEMPPKFLPVPTEPTLSPARPDAPEPWRGDVEVGWRPELTFPGRD